MTGVGMILILVPGGLLLWASAAIVLGASRSSRRRRERRAIEAELGRRFTVERSEQGRLRAMRRGGAL